MFALMKVSVLTTFWICSYFAFATDIGFVDLTKKQAENLKGLDKLLIKAYISDRVKRISTNDAMDSTEICKLVINHLQKRGVEVTDTLQDDTGELRIIVDIKEIIGSKNAYAFYVSLKVFQLGLITRWDRSKEPISADLNTWETYEIGMIKLRELSSLGSKINSLLELLIHDYLNVNPLKIKR